MRKTIETLFKASAPYANWDEIFTGMTEGEKKEVLRDLNKTEQVERFMGLERKNDKEHL